MESQANVLERESMSKKLQQLQTLLAEVFQLDQAELDFGIYRIMNMKRQEIIDFLERNLLPQVREAFQAYESGNRTVLQTELDEAIAKAKELGADAETLPRIKELREKLVQTVDTNALEEEVYSHLYNFFRRYYQEGDFISLRRYKEGIYAVPYEGEEVKLYWANRDQYYIKTSEYFRDYTFTLPSGKRVHFKIIEANAQKENNRPSNGDSLRFFLCEECPLIEDNGELTIRFEHKSISENGKQTELNRAAVERILNPSTGFDNWRQELSSLRPTEKNASRTLLEKHLRDYTSRNTFDYFIHKNLEKFLRRELDFYIKNEVMYLDDIDQQTAVRADQYLSKIKAIRQIAHKIIDFLSQIEDFQKKLWLKKKLVIETRYCITLALIFAMENEKDRKWLLEQIMKNDSQQDEWERLCAINEVRGDLIIPAYSKPLKLEFLKAHSSLMIDTRHFDKKFKYTILANLDNLDDKIDGLLVQGENFQALNLMHARYKEQIKCIYIDPPYNTDASAILYKNDYKDSSWLSLIENRLEIAKTLLSKNGIICIAIDDEEAAKLRLLLSNIFYKKLGITAVRSNPAGRKTKGSFSPAHEYAMFYGKSEESIPMGLDITEQRLARYPHKDEKGNYAWANFIRSGSNDKREDRPRLFYPIFVSNNNQIRIPKIKWDDGACSYKLLESPKSDETIVYPIVKRGAVEIEKNWHRGHERVMDEVDEYRIRRSSNGGISIDFKTRLDEESLPTTWWDKPEYASANYGAAELKALFGDKIFDFAKARRLVQDCIITSGAKLSDSITLDFFAGSGTTGEAIINLNREDGGNRKFILVEVGDHFETVVVPRIKKVVFTPEWIEGKPRRSATEEEIKRSPQIIKILQLESYEDSLNNLEMRSTGPQQLLLAQQPAFREDYVLRYMLDVETRNSVSLLDFERFEDPFKYKLNISTKSVSVLKSTIVDLVETFNYLLGLRVGTIREIDGVQVVTGINSQNERVLVLWRSVKEMGNDALDAWFGKRCYNKTHQDFDIIYVNGDNNIENLRQPEQTWKVWIIEEEFKRLMFDTQDA